MTFPRCWTRGSKVEAIDLLASRLERATTSKTGLLLVLADAAEVLTGKGITLRADSLQRLQRLLLEAMTGPAPVATRADVGSALAALAIRAFERIDGGCRTSPSWDSF